MARIGFKKGKYNKMNPTTKQYEALKDSKVPRLEMVIDEKFSPEFNSAELYADDILAECDYTFKKGSITITVANDDDEKDAEIMGNTISDGEVVRAITDNAPEVGYGHIVTKIVGGIYKYKVEFFPRIKFTKIVADAKTRAENVEFSTTSIEGTVFPLAEDFNGMKAGTWEMHKTFDTEAEAEEYLDECLTPSAS